MAVWRWDCADILMAIGVWDLAVAVVGVLIEQKRSDEDEASSEVGKKAP